MSLCYGPDSLLYTTSCVARLSAMDHIVCYTRLSVWHVSLSLPRQFVVRDQLCGTSLCYGPDNLLYTTNCVARLSVRDHIVCGTRRAMWHVSLLCYTRLTVWHVSVIDQIVCYTRLAVWHVSLLWTRQFVIHDQLCGTSLSYGPDSFLYTTSCVARLSVMDHIVCYTRLVVWHVSLLWTRQFVKHDQLCGISLCQGPYSLWYETSYVARLSVMDQIVCYTRLAVWHVSQLWARQFFLYMTSCVARLSVMDQIVFLYTTSCVARLSVMDQIVCYTRLSVWHVSLSLPRQFVVRDQLCGTSLCYGPDNLLYTTSCVARLSVMGQIVFYTRLAVWHVSLLWTRQFVKHDQLCGTCLCQGPYSLWYETSYVARLSVMDQIVFYTRLAVWHVSLLWTRQFFIHDQLCGTSLCYGPDSLLYTTICVARLSVIAQIVCGTRLAVWHVSLLWTR